ncbi:MAG: hypothetical protein HY275_05970 [Gemmatimonadetes bacterium]|nr:hypothetical protein [Gemmatimonadota bacterium]
MMHRRRLRAVLPLSAILVLVACGGATELPRFSLHQPMEAGRVLALRNVRGDVKVVPATDGQLSIVAQGATDGSRPEHVHVVSAETPTGLAVCAVWGNSDRCSDGGYEGAGPRGWDRWSFRSRVKVNFTVAVPPGVKLDVRSIEGDVSVAGASADVLVHAVTGGIEAGTTAGSLELKTVTGSVTARATSAVERVVAKTVTGEVQVLEPADFAGDVEMSVVTGAMMNDFPVTTTGSLSKRRLAGHIGTGGSSRLELKSVTGSVSLRKRA